MRDKTAATARKMKTIPATFNGEKNLKDYL